MKKPTNPSLKLPVPRICPALDEGFRPAVLANRAFREVVSESGAGVPLVLDLERADGSMSRFETEDEGAARIRETIGTYRGYAIAHYADFYELRHVLILGRCTFGRGGSIILDGARAVLDAEFPSLAAEVNIRLPDEKSRRVGQAIAAASWPIIEEGV